MKRDRIDLGLEPELRLALPGSAHKPAPFQNLTHALQHIMQEAQKELGLLSNTRVAGALATASEMQSIVTQVSERLGLELTVYERDQILAHLENDAQPFGILQQLVDDPAISDIIVAGHNSVTVQQGRRNYTTSVRFPNQATYEAFVERLLARAGSTYSTKKPIADGMIGGFARVHVVHSSIAEDGPYLTIRLNRFATVSLTDLEKSGLAPELLLGYLKAMVKIGQTILLVGEVGTGKTTLARALAGTISQEESILVIEDTPEIKLNHPNVRYIRTREANTDGAGKVTPSECIRGGMRMAMNRIIFGEMRDAEAAESFIDVCASGHPGLSTIHGRSALDAIARLELFLGRAQKGVAQSVIQNQISTAVQVVVYIDICRTTGKRRIVEVVEIGAVADGTLRHKTVFKYLLSSGFPVWEVVNKTSSFRDRLELDAGYSMSTLPRYLETNLGGNFAEVSQRLCNG